MPALALGPDKPSRQPPCRQCECSRLHDCISTVWPFTSCISATPLQHGRSREHAVPCGRPILCRTSSQAMARRSSFSPTICARRCQKTFTYAVRASHALKHHKTAMYLFFAQANSPTATHRSDAEHPNNHAPRLPTVPTLPTHHAADT